ncbi:hypothetical protein BS47DRAFT_633159 [Hydnum rufescens UP504]|uniref:Uncharacterized protein n=1 Tax=Hydnum rufescens UP504 TaxID=1448309 RepID=A0A9P6AFI9_9AGAM|nr:hypothetical protein BS47DRAFT_633159 [Hydnum rufescens UP504]
MRRLRRYTVHWQLVDPMNSGQNLPTLSTISLFIFRPLAAMKKHLEPLKKLWASTACLWWINPELSIPAWRAHSPTSLTFCLILIVSLRLFRLSSCYSDMGQHREALQTQMEVDGLGL